MSLTILATALAINLLIVAVWAWQKPRLDAAERCVLLDSEIRA